MAGALTARSEAYVMRIACEYALFDCSAIIRPEHLNAALAIWDYSEQSVVYIYGDKTGDVTIDTILITLRSSPDGLSRTEISGRFAGHKTSEEITRALEILKEHNLVESKMLTTAGRYEQRWIAK